METKTPPSALDQAVIIAGGGAALARLCKVSPQAVHKWILKGRPPIERCAAIEVASGGKVTRSALIPEVFGNIKRIKTKIPCVDK